MCSALEIITKIQYMPQRENKLNSVYVQSTTTVLVLKKTKNKQRCDATALNHTSAASRAQFGLIAALSFVAQIRGFRRIRHNESFRLMPPFSVLIVLPSCQQDI